MEKNYTIVTLNIIMIKWAMIGLKIYNQLVYLVLKNLIGKNVWVNLLGKESIKMIKNRLLYYRKIITKLPLSQGSARLRKIKN